jgi:hypothetical protein
MKIVESSTSLMMPFLKQAARLEVIECTLKATQIDVLYPNITYFWTIVQLTACYRVLLEKLNWSRTYLSFMESES